jgi:hypothetical protein
MNPSHDSRSPDAGGGRWFLGLLGISVAIIGAVFAWLMWRSFDRARQMRGWPQVTCHILDSRIESRRHDPQSPIEYRHVVAFGYGFNGRYHTSDRITARGSSWSSKRGPISDSAKRYPTRQQTHCHVNPQDPSFAVLRPDSLGPGYSLWFPCLFIIGGGGIALRALLTPQKRG